MENNEMKRARKMTKLATHEEVLARAKKYAKKTGDLELQENIYEEMTKGEKRIPNSIFSKLKSSLKNLSYPKNLLNTHPAYDEYYKKQAFEIQDNNELNYAKHEANVRSDIFEYQDYLIREFVNNEGKGNDKNFINNLLRALIKEENLGLAQILLRKIKEPIIEKGLYNTLEEKLIEDKQKGQLEELANQMGFPPEKYLFLLEIDDPNKRLEEVNKIIGCNYGGMKDGVVASVSKDKRDIIAYNGYSFINLDIHTAWNEHIDDLNINPEKIIVSSWRGEYENLKDKVWIFPIGKNFSTLDYDKITTKIAVEKSKRLRKERALERELQGNYVKYVNNMINRQNYY